MGIYILNLILIIFWAVIIKKCEISNRKLVYVVIISIQLFLTLILRSENVGADILNYFIIFDNLSNSTFEMLDDFRHEKGFLIFTKFISLMTINHHTYLVIVAFITVFSIAYFIYKYSTIPALSFYLYITLGFYSFTFSGVRQALAYSIILFSYKYIKEKRFIAFLIIVIIASMFHKTAILFLIAYFIAHKKITYKYIIVYFLTFLTIFIFKFNIMSYFNQIFFSEYDIYNSGAYTMLFITIFVVVFLLIFYKQVISYNENAIINYNLVLFSLLLIVFASTSSNALRVSDYYYYFILLLLPDFVVSFKDGNLRFLAYFAIVALTLSQFIYLTPSSLLKVVPYEFFWQK